MGPLLCLLSAAGFGAMAIFGKLAYDAGVGVGDLLLVRFALAAALLLAVAAAHGRAAWPAAPAGARRRWRWARSATPTQSGLYFAALERMDASLLALILYVYPALVLVGGGRARPRARDRVRRIAALRDRHSPAPRSSSLGAASGSARRARHRRWASAPRSPTPSTSSSATASVAGVPPVALAALVCPGATVHVRASSRRAAAVRSSASAPTAGHGSAAIALVSTVGAILAFFAGLARVGPSAASILSTLEPVVTVGARGGGVRRDARRGAAARAARSCSAPCVVMQWPAGAAVSTRVAGRGGERQRRALREAGSVGWRSLLRGASGGPGERQRRALRGRVRSGGVPARARAAAPANVNGGH